MIQMAMGFIKRLLLLCVLALAVAGLGAFQHFNQWLHSSAALPADGLDYRLPRGGSLSSVAHELGERDILRYPQVLLLYARLTGQSEVRAGDYHFPSGASPVQILTRLNSGDVVQYQVTFIEGWTFAEAVEALARAPRLEARLAGLSREAQLAMLDLPIEHPEGWFFPDTYQYNGGTSDVAILRRAYQKMRSLLDELWRERAQGLPYESPYQALIMASIVERETGAAWERQKIAGVFVRRLEKGMRLQTDPTVIYGMGSDYDGQITREDLNRPTAYNTYTMSGLPPTPIALPGRGALYASLNPQPGQALYFVAKGDGTHAFSATLAEHNRAVRQYQLQRRSDYRSTPKAGFQPSGE